MALDPERKRGINRLGWILAAIMGLVLFSVLRSSSHNPASSPVAAPTPTIAATPSLAVTAPQLYRDYHRNEVSADTKYKGKTLAVTGRVTGISKDFAGGVYLTLDNGESEFLGIHAELQPSEVDKASTLSKGRTVTVVCEGGEMVIGTPILKDCVIQ
jgi:hypothetical protein